jgi:hypothetical protein
MKALWTVSSKGKQPRLYDAEVGCLVRTVHLYHITRSVVAHTYLRGSNRSTWGILDFRQPHARTSFGNITKNANITDRRHAKMLASHLGCTTPTFLLIGLLTMMCYA